MFSAYDIITYYIVFCLSGGIVTLTSIYLPIVGRLRYLSPYSRLCTSKGTFIGGIGFYFFSIITGPAMLIMLAHKEVFIQSVIKGMLNDN